ncbi:ubiquitin carboxy terminal hydrolase Ubp22 [Schizosaccharomyces cryophilus OY26]|uniref:ubiquitinyl hydrolase 1 n=1 Tax=Schizosaccharomyces cryophilus (strain OY26 / ATCC MYA-4695 / CBS 11777 / NBRC 106824 / NRRL Y48691) TaxID=653667 RepID=S9VZP7_SCHCR|nr:ubiquitin carboxy terminal hydrolase Ubp22 [Schizosaccharomyces cryophilus OY26]EPY51310.1 ubiquitin carboxy terminal hydrolase Ubp22 [Schizosaccharomyces cryophilus OY26]
MANGEIELKSQETPLVDLDTKTIGSVSSLNRHSQIEEETVKEELTLALPDYDDVAYGSYTWEIKNWHELDSRASSRIFEVGGRQFRIVYFPQGISQSSGYTSLFLEYIPFKEEKEKQDYGVCCQFALIISNLNNPSLRVASAAHCRYSPEIADWGFTQFTETKRLLSRESPVAPPIVEDGALRINAYVRILDDPTGVLWHSFNHYDSKSMTGYVGLKNQGATCYMNSLLQSLYIIGAFRRIVYQVPTEREESKNGIAYALQRCFYNLQFMNEPVPTTDLTKSFGWDSLDSFMQHDVQEFNRVLQDNLERSMEGTMENALKNLFSGKMKSYVACMNVNYESARTEEFWDIQLNVKGMKNLEASFRDYIQVETLDGDNCYYADTYGFQEAKKGVIFESFPPILHLQLKRFEYDFERDMMIKINDRYEFPLEFNAKAFLTPEADQDQNCEYVLHGVLVHSGDLDNGHYYALLKPQKDGGWYKFDDTRVTPATLKEVLEENYGGDYIVHPPFRSAVKLKRFMSAYMLLYLRKDKIDELMAPVQKDEIPNHLKEVLDENIRLVDQQRKERLESHLYTKVEIITPDYFANHHEFDLVNFGNTVDEEAMLHFRIKKELKFSDLVPMISEKIDIPAKRLRLWYVVRRQNFTVRVEEPVNELTLSIEEAKDKWNSQGEILRLYLEILPENQTVDTLINVSFDSHDAFLFIKYFDRESQEIIGSGTIFVNKYDRIDSICPELCERVGLLKDTPLYLYEEIKPGYIEYLRLNKTFSEGELGTGDIICFEKAVSETKDWKDKRFPTAVQLYDFMANRVLITFRPRFIDQESILEFELVLDRRMKLVELSAELGEKLGTHADHIRLTTCSPLTYSANMVIPNNPNITLYDIIHSSDEDTVSNILFYEIMDVSLSDLDKKRLLRVTWLFEGLANAELIDVYIYKIGNVSDVFNAVCEKYPELELPNQKVRFYEVLEYKWYRDINMRTMIRSLNPFARIIGEVIPEEEINLQDDERVIVVYHFHKDIARMHSIPFKFVIKPGERFAITRERLRFRTMYPDNIFSVIKFAIIDFDMHSVVYLNDDDVVFEILQQCNGTLALDRAKKEIRKPTILDRAIQMKG